MKQCQQVSIYNSCRTSCDKTDKKLYILGENGLEWYGKGTATNKQCKIGQRNTHYCAKRSWNTKQIWYARKYWEGEGEAGEHKEWLPCSVLMLIILLIPEQL